MTMEGVVRLVRCDVCLINVVSHCCDVRLAQLRRSSRTAATFVSHRCDAMNAAALREIWLNRAGRTMVQSSGLSRTAASLWRASRRAAAEHGPEQASRAVRLLVVRRAVRSAASVRVKRTRPRRPEALARPRRAHPVCFSRVSLDASLSGRDPVRLRGRRASGRLPNRTRPCDWAGPSRGRIAGLARHFPARTPARPPNGRSSPYGRKRVGNTRCPRGTRSAR